MTIATREQPAAPVWRGARVEMEAQRLRLGFQPHPCDVRCTSARGPVCECACNGRNHGVDWHPEAEVQDELFTL